MGLAESLLEKDLLPDPLIRLGIRRLLAQRLAEEDPGGEAARREKVRDLAVELASGPLAVHTEEANAQHYEVPTEFFRLVLGRHLKYSSAWWPEGVESLDAAEAAMLRLSAERAELEDGQRILELGCGWGSLTFHMAERLPGAQILAVSNSETQQAYIRGEARRRGLENIETRKADLRELTLEERFDRVVSVEMFEHMRNYRLLMEKVAGWLEPGGKLFVHVFCHRHLAYPFEVRDASDWMARYFFTGGMMPAADLLEHFQDDLALEERWLVGGEHYARTARAWLENMDRRKEEVLPILERVYGRGERRRWWVRWRVFFLACEELFAYRGGREWMVSHYRFRKP